MHLTTSLTAGLVGAGLVSAQFRYADNRVTLNKNPDHVSANFPDVDTELLSPAFLNPESVSEGFTDGRDGPTSQQALENFLWTLSSRNEWMTYYNSTFDSEEGRSIPYVVLSTTPEGPLQARSGRPGCSQKKVRVWMQGGVHGNEPAGDEALLAFLGKLDAEPEWAASLLEKLEILVLPRYNPDGVAYFQRFLATNFDPNRDHTKLASTQTREIKKLNRQFNAHLSLDCHEYGAARRLRANGGEYMYLQDNQFSAFKNPNVHASIRGLGESLFVPEVHSALNDNNMTASGYVVAFQDPNAIRLTDFVTDVRGDVAVFLGQGLAFLSETRGIALGDQHFRRRTAAGLTAAVAVAQIAADNAKLVYDTVEAARADFITNDQEIIITESPRWENTTWPFIDANTGSVVQVPVQFGNNTPPASNLTRARPEAYIFSRAWSGAAESLRVAGVEVEELPEEFNGEVEAFNVTSVVVAPTKYEGTALTTVTKTEMWTKTMRFPKGAYWVSTRQQNAGQAFVRLEPEHPDSFATFNILPVSAGDEYQVYRIPA